MADATISLVVATISRPQLARTLRSLRGQPWGPGDEVLLVGDGPQDQARELWEQFGLPGRYLETPRRLGSWGHPLRNGVFDERIPRAAHVAALDDDDEWTPDALTAIRSALAAAPGRPHLFRMRGCPVTGTCWKVREVVEGNVGTPMFVTPNDYARLGRYTPRYGGDYDFIAATVGLYSPGEAVWSEAVICEVRPGRGEEVFR